MIIGNQILYKRRFWDMSGKRRARNNSSNQNNTTKAETPANTDIEPIKKVFEHPLVITILGGVLVTVIINIAVLAFVIPERISGLQKDIENMRNDISNMRSDIVIVKSDLEDRITEVRQDLSNDITEIRSDIKDINALVIPKYVLLKSVGDDFSFAQISQKEMNLLNSPSWNDTDIIAIGSENGQRYSAEDLAEEKLLLSSVSDNGQETYFYGQFNENNHWDGKCIINVYHNDTLILITEAIYDDGNLCTYKQVIRNDDTWILSERKNEGDFNSGDSWSYFRENEYIKEFMPDNVEFADIFNIETFKSNILVNAKSEGYYHGNTSDGLYNDCSDDAYLVKYANDGTVRYIYHGNFKNGLPDDNTGKAWDIAKEHNTAYMYYKGIFENGYPRKALDRNHVFINPITIEEIEKIIEDDNTCQNIKCELVWSIN